jgi:PAS domain S-box-containing protein
MKLPKRVNICVTKRNIFIISLAIILVLFLSCSKPSQQIQGEFQHISFRNVPGITDDEIKAIEALQNEYAYFIYGMPLSIEAFKNEKGEVRGYAALLCEWLTNVFDIRFLPKLYDWPDLLTGLEAGEISFTGELTATPGRLRSYYMTSDIALRPLKYYRLAGSRPLEEIKTERLLRCGFIAGTNTIYTITAELEDGTYEIVLLNDVSLVYDALKSGQIDAFYYSGTAEANFVQYSDINVMYFYPLIYRPVSMTTQTSALQPVISVVEKILEAGGLRYMIELYNRGEQEYYMYKLHTQFTDEEHDYIMNRPVILIGVDPGNYPGCFYDRREKEWRGISLDILAEVSALTGLTFKRINDEHTGWPAIYQMLRNGDIALVPELTQSAERIGQFIWTETVQMTDSYALISDYNFPNIKVNEVLYVKVGLAKNTAYTAVFKKWFSSHMNTVEYESMEDAFEALKRGEVDMVMASKKRLLYLTHYLELPNYKVNILFDYAFNVKFGLNKDEVILASIIDKALNMIDSKGISEQWMRKTYDYRLKLIEAQRPWFIGSSILLLCVLALVAVFLVKSYRTSRILGKLVKKRTQELELKTATLTTLFDSIPDLIFTKDLYLRYTQCNKSMADHFNFRREEVIGKTDLVPFGLSAELSTKYNNILKNVLQDGKNITVEDPVPRFDGTVPIFESTYAPLLLNGKTIGVLGISRDITKHKTMEEAALAASRSKSVFLANMSHEIRTPMNSIIGFAELSMDDQIPAKAREYIGKLLENAEGLLRIINDILDISKVESGKMELENIPFVLHDLFTSCRMLIMPKADEKGIKLHFYAEPSVGMMPLGDPTRLRQVLVNLLSNAVKFTNTGIVKLCAAVNDRTDKTVTIHFTIKDSGIGMTPEQIEKIFEPFAQAETGTTRKYGGTGLGLAITKNIIELMGGKLFVESTPGIGSKFSFDLTFNTIRINKEEEVFIKKPQLDDIEKPVFEGEVLLCEDNVMNQQVICEHLSRIGLKQL